MKFFIMSVLAVVLVAKENIVVVSKDANTTSKEMATSKFKQLILNEFAKNVQKVKEVGSSKR